MDFRGCHCISKSASRVSSHCFQSASTFLRIRQHPTRFSTKQQNFHFFLLPSFPKQISTHGLTKLITFQFPLVRRKVHTLFPHSIDKNFLAAASGHNFSLLPRAFCVLFSVVSSIFNKHFTRAPPRLFRVKIFALFRTMRSALRAELPVFPSPPEGRNFRGNRNRKFSALSPRGRAGYSCEFFVFVRQDEFSVSVLIFSL